MKKRNINREREDEILEVSIFTKGHTTVFRYLPGGEGDVFDAIEGAAENPRRPYFNRDDAEELYHQMGKNLGLV